MKLSAPLRIQLSAILFVLAGILSFVCYQLKQERISDPANISAENPYIETSQSDDRSQQNLASVKVEEHPLVPSGYEGNVSGDNSAIRFEKDLETSILKQDPPTIQLNFSTTSGEVQSADIVLLARKTLSRTWKTNLQLCQRNISEMDHESRFEVQRSYLNSNAMAIQYLENLTVNTPFGTRKISENEASKIVTTLNKLAIRRFRELSSMDTSLREGKFIEPVSY